MALVGGFISAYTLLNHNLLGSAQTLNMITLSMNIVGQDYHNVLVRILSLLIYMSGLSCTVILPKYTKVNMKLFSILIDMVAVIILGFLKESMNDFVALYPIFFAMPVQWDSFKGAEGHVSSSIFLTSNTKQLTTSLIKYLCDKDKTHLHVTKFYGEVLFSFNIGVAISYLSCRVYGLRSSWICLFPLLTAFSLVCLECNWKYD